jgi:large subunit ribosomal protein L10
MRTGYKTHVSEDKKKEVSELSKSISESPIIGIVNLQNLPTQQLNNMRKQLRKNQVTIKMSKMSLIRLAIEKVKDSKKGIEELETHLKGMPAILFTKENPFKLFKILKKNKSKASAKTGQVLPADAKISAGPTNFAPGPIISELASFGIKTKVENGKLAILQDTVIAKRDTVVDDKLASMLMRLGIEPMEIGLDLTAIYENGLVFTRDILDVDEDMFKQDIDNAARWAFNLSVEAAYPTSDNITLLLTKTYLDTKALAIDREWICSETVEGMVVKAQNQMLSVKSVLGI